MEAHKIGVIIPTTKEKLNDTIINIFEEMKKPVADAIQQKFDMAGLSVSTRLSSSISSTMLLKMKCLS